MNIWRKLSIRWQLIILITLLLVAIQSATFVLINKFDHSERQHIAIEQSQTMVRSMNNVILRALLNPTSDNYADISFQASGYPSVDALILLDDKDQRIFSFGEEEYTLMPQVNHVEVNKPLFDDEHLFIKMPVHANDYVFGHALTIIDPEQYSTQIEERFESLMWLFPIELLFALFIAWRISLHYTRPFAQLAKAMQSNDVENNQFTPISTQADNEVKQMFHGYNAMISQIESTTKDMLYRSSHDGLTDLLNREGFERELDQALHTSNPNENALIKMDLDQFKLVNDSAGHAAGDELLKLVSNHLIQTLPKNSAIARIGGDDFMILLKQLSQTDAKQIANQLLDSLKDFRFIWDDEPLSTSASMGMITFIPYEYTRQELSKLVDSAFYVAKSTGRNKLHIYSPDDQHNQQFDRDIVIAGQIKEALNGGPALFELYAQAIVPLQKTTTQCSYEILLRLKDAQGQIVRPDHFLPTADRYQLMADIDSFVLNTYLETVTQHPEHIQNLHTAHVNLAGSSLNHPDFQANLKQAVKNYKFPWHKLELEVTETSAVGNLNKATDFINYFRGLGIGFALDDFGTGMSSFEYLKSLPFDVVKIDGSFVKDMHNDPVDKAVIRYIQEISDLKNQKTVAEYVETEEDVIALTEIGVTYGQGYHLGKPKPLNEWIQPDNAKPDSPT